MRLYVSGCSLTYGDELVDPASSAWPILLAEKLGANLTNTSQPSSSNYRMVYQTVKHSQYNYDLYIIAWSNYARFTFYKTDNNHDVSFTPQLKHNLYGNEKFYLDWGKTLYTVWYNELFAFKLWLQQIIQLQNLLKSKNYLMINAFHNNLNLWLAPKDNFIDSVKELINFNSMTDDQLIDEHKEIQYYISLIDTSKFYRWNDFHINQLCAFFKYGPGGHILEDGHVHLSELLYQHVQN